MTKIFPLLSALLRQFCWCAEMQHLHKNVQVLYILMLLDGTQTPLVESLFFSLSTETNSFTFKNEVVIQARRRNNVVTITTRVRLDDWEIMVTLPAGIRAFPSLQNSQTFSGAYPTSHPTGIRGPFSWIRVAETWSLPHTHTHLYTVRVLQGCSKTEHSSPRQF